MVHLQQITDKKRVKHIVSETKKYLGYEVSATSRIEKLISGVGATIGVLLCQIITFQYFSSSDSLLLIASIGATATLIFALPHSALSQPWNVFMGHVISAVVGIWCYQHIPNELWASSMAVGGAVIFMFFLRCIHPPGGGTAFFCVHGGVTVHELGFNFLLEPLLQNLIIIIGVAIMFNGFFPWRRYPAHFNFRYIKNKSLNYLTHEDVSAALLQLDSFVDVSTEELAIIFDKAFMHADLHKPQRKLQLKVGGYYSNGSLGERWNVKKITQIEKSKITLKIVAGKEQGLVKKYSYRTFQRWAKFEVYFADGSWIKKAGNI